MKKLLLSIFAIGLAAMSLAQNSGLGFNYQAVVRNADGYLLANSNVTLRVSLYPGQHAASPSWVETHNIMTDQSGCFGITVGHGQRDNASTAANYSDVNFAAVYYWMRIEVQEGGNWREVSFAQLQSCPYCEVANNATLFPAGIIIPFAGSAENIPDGWLLCDGAELDRSTYSRLFSAIGVDWGTGNGSTTFNCPDLRGYFLRGWSGTSGVDPDADGRIPNEKGGNGGNRNGSKQGDAVRPFGGSFKTVDRGNTGVTGVFSDGGDWGTYFKGSDHGDNWGATTIFDISLQVPVGGDIRPKNVAVTYIIKY